MELPNKVWSKPESFINIHPIGSCDILLTGQTNKHRDRHREKHCCPQLLSLVVGNDYKSLVLHQSCSAHVLFYFTVKKQPTNKK